METEKEMFEEYMETQKETFEEYMTIHSTSAHPEDFQKIRSRIQVHQGLSGYLQVLLTNIRFGIHEPQNQYTYLYHCIKETYEACRSEPHQELVLLCQAMYHLETDCGCGAEVPNLRPGMSTKKQNQILQLLDADLEKFHVVMHEYIQVLKPHPVLLEYFLTFAGLIFRFNGYQAPFRTDPQQALADASGLTDLYIDYLHRRLTDLLTLEEVKRYLHK